MWLVCCVHVCVVCSVGDICVVRLCACVAMHDCLWLCGVHQCTLVQYACGVRVCDVLADNGCVSQVPTQTRDVHRTHNIPRVERLQDTVQLQST